MNVIGIIPARYGSTRFPGKPLAMIAGKSLLQRVVEQARKAKRLTEIVVATDDERIRSVASRYCRVEMTSPEHPSGTDRAAEIARNLPCEGIVNIQGDEPLIDPAVIDKVADLLEAAPMSTAGRPISDPSELNNPNVVKVVVRRNGAALYFSRRTIPYLRDQADRSPEEHLAAFPFLKHLGIYGYRRETLLRLVEFPLSALEKAERLEQLRALDNGIEIQVARVEEESLGVDVPSDVARVEAVLRLAHLT
ncbi:MAG: 3-deoxy-manno-octulosonate cytidylyltransferase [Verrucomicrobia bacterium]|nr:3-deoxy-manno-octulosonate cytidylyltransferase [Verrucomicrobiota bacterium]